MRVAETAQSMRTNPNWDLPKEVGITNLTKAQPTEFTTADETTHVIARTIVQFQQEGLTPGTGLYLTYLKK